MKKSTTKKQKTTKMQNTANQNINTNENKNNNDLEFVKTPSSKRMREALQNSLLSNISKTPRITDTESPLKFITIMDKRFEKLANQIQEMMQNKFVEYKNDLLNELDKRFCTMKNVISEVSEKVNKLETEITKIETVESKIKKMGEEIKTLKTQLRRQENFTIAKDIRINEIPFSPNENLHEIFKNICSTINTTIPPIKSIYRLQNHNNKKKNDSPDAAIIVKMWSPYDKNFFLKTLSNFKKLNKDFSFRLNQIGFVSENRFFVNESLTKDNYEILRAAVKMKRERRIHSAFSMRGIVYVKKTANDPIIQIDEIEHLDWLFPVSGDQFSFGASHQSNNTMQLQ